MDREVVGNSGEDVGFVEEGAGAVTQVEGKFEEGSTGAVYAGPNFLDGWNKREVGVYMDAEDGVGADDWDGGVI